MFTKESFFRAASEVSGKAFELGKTATNVAGDTLSGLKDRVTGEPVDLDIVAADLLRTIDETKSEFLGSRFKEILEKHFR